MRPESHISLSPCMEDAVHELEGMITKRFPQATFVVEEGADPKGIYLVTTVDMPIQMRLSTWWETDSWSCRLMKDCQST